MRIEDSNPLSRPENLPPREEGEKTPEQVVATARTPEQPIPDPTQTEEAKAERETARLARVEELRQQLGVPGANQAEGREDEKKKERAAQEDMENISDSFRRLATSLEELSGVVGRNKFPRVKFEPDNLKTLSRKETIDQGAISRELGNISMLTTRIRFPEDRGDMMELEPRNFRAVIDAMESLNTELSSLRRKFDEAKSQDLGNLAQEVSRIRVKVSGKIEGFTKALVALRRIRER